MKILSIEAERVKKLSLVNLKLDGDNLIVAGDTNQGKTTLINLLWMAIDAKKIGREVIQAGEKTGYIAIELGEPGKKYSVKVTRKFSEKSGDAGRLKVESGDGKPLKASFLTDLVSSLTFDPLEFLSRKGKDQVDMLLSVSDVDVSRLEQMENDYNVLYNERTMVNREVKRWESIVGKKPPEEARVDVQSMVDEITRLHKHNEKVKDMNDTLDKLRIEEGNILDDIAALQEKLKTVQSRIKKGEEVTAKYEILPTEDLQEKLKNVQEINKRAEEYEAWVKNSKILEDNKAEATLLNEKLEAIQNEKINSLKNAKWPVSGMEVRDGEIYVDNVLLNNCGDSQKLQVSFAVAISLHPTLKCCRIDGAESLGAKGRANIIEMAEQNDFQVLMSRVSDDGAGDGEIIIEEGIANNQ